MKKTDALRRHARRRAAERYSLNLSRRVHDEIVHKIQTGRSTFIRRTSLRAVIHDVILDDDGDTIRVVYDKHRKQLVTVLPRSTADGT